MASLHSGHEFKQTLGDGGGQRSLACCSPQGHRIRLDLATGQQNMYYEANFLIIKYCVVKGKIISFPETSFVLCCVFFFFFNGSFKIRHGN